MADNKIIYADKLQKAIVDDVTIKGRAFAAVMRHLQAAPTVDAVEVVHGRWIDVNGRKYLGSYCSHCQKWSDYKSNYCPHCGAKMDGGNEDV